MTESSGSPDFLSVDIAMQVWRQGDVAQVRVFQHFADLRRPVTSGSAELSESPRSGDSPTVRIGTAVEGLVILTQTCDIRRSAASRPYVEVCPLIRVDPATAQAASAREMPRYAAVPTLGSDAVADLDRVMTVEKGWLSFASRIPGWATDHEIRLFQAAVARRYQRFAFPDDFTKSMSKLREKIVARHGKQTSPEGRLFALVREIRVIATPHWSADRIEATLIFILPGGTLGTVPEELTEAPRLGETLRWLSARTRSSTEIAERILSEPDSTSVGTLWKRLAEAWSGSCRPIGCIGVVYGEAIDANEYPVAEYWAGDQLDLDYLSDESPVATDVANTQDTANGPRPQSALLKRIWPVLRFMKKLARFPRGAAHAVRAGGRGRGTHSWPSTRSAPK